MSLRAVTQNPTLSSLAVGPLSRGPQPRLVALELSTSLTGTLRGLLCLCYGRGPEQRRRSDNRGLHGGSHRGAPGKNAVPISWSSCLLPDPWPLQPVLLRRPLSLRQSTRGCHGYIPEEYIHALYSYPLRIRAEDAYPKCIMRKRGEDISILSDKNCEIVSDPSPRYESQDTGIYKMIRLLATAEFQ